MDIDLWFSRYNDRIYVVSARHDEAPTFRPRALKPGDSVTNVIRRYKNKNLNVVQVGILPPDMIGLEVEV